MILQGSEVSDLFGRRAELDENSIRDSIIELESRITWITSELDDPKNQSSETCRYSKDMLESLQDERSLMTLLTNVLYRRAKMIEK